MVVFALAGAFHPLLADTLTVEKVRAALIGDWAQIACCWLRLAVSVIAFGSLRFVRTQRDVKSLLSSVNSCASWTFEVPRACAVDVVLPGNRWYSLIVRHGCGLRAIRVFI